MLAWSLRKGFGGGSTAHCCSKREEVSLDKGGSRSCKVSSGEINSIVHAKYVMRSKSGVKSVCASRLVGAQEITALLVCY